MNASDRRPFPRYAPKCDWRHRATREELFEQGRRDFERGEPRPYDFDRARGYDAAKRETLA